MGRPRICRSTTSWPRSSPSWSPSRWCSTIISGDAVWSSSDGKAGHAVPETLALLHRAQIRGHRRGGGDRALRRIPVLVSLVMARERLYLFDTTLRDGAQTNGVDFTLNDKLAIAKMLADLGIDYVEGGYPGANLTDTELFADERKLATTFTAFGMTRRPGRSTSND